ncbi:hypothetical protein [Niveispirillum irakense]|uniref:hypothetical protein n=1 Tax=Niveispirillum irakense TaxID=34011 RepID=UPI00137798B8|nr:hypothetical protein [Niveispirillum irakense]
MKRPFWQACAAGWASILSRGRAAAGWIGSGSAGTEHVPDDGSERTLDDQPLHDDAPD